MCITTRPLCLLRKRLECGSRPLSSTRSAQLVSWVKAVTRGEKKAEENDDSGDVKSSHLKHQFPSSSYRNGFLFPPLRFHFKQTKIVQLFRDPSPISVHHYTGCSPHPSQCELRCRCKLTGIPFMCQNNPPKPEHSIRPTNEGESPAIR